MTRDKKRWSLLLAASIVFMVAGTLSAQAKSGGDTSEAAYHTEGVTRFTRGAGDGATYLDCAWNDIGKDFFVGRHLYDGPIVVWKFEWEGSACFDNHNQPSSEWRIRKIAWRKPTGWTLGISGWSYRAGDLQLIDKAGLTLPSRYAMKWYRGHFDCCVGTTLLNKWPCLRVELWSSATIGTYSESCTR